MKEIPPTSKTRYLTGACALNIPAPERTTGDWHFQNVFFVSPQPAQIAGDGPDTLVNTNPIFGAYGIHECSDVLRKLGLALRDGAPVYAANHYRAILDLLISSARAEKSADYLAEPEVWLDTVDNVHRLVALARQAESFLSGEEQKTVTAWTAKVLS